MSGIDTSGVSLFQELKIALEKKSLEARMLSSDKLGLFTHHNPDRTKISTVTNWNEL